MIIREISEWNEKYNLDFRAKLSTDSEGRERNEKLCPIRTDFQRDRDRIVHSSAFRRLMHKTQVFLSPKSEYYRTRLTHSLEVAQIAKTLARALRMNEDLTEAIALGHDLGHTPFGHTGEKVMNSLLPGGFVHAAQSVRVAQVIEKNGNGLNLTFEVMDGIRNHSNGEAKTLEGQIVKFADKIAYINHDIDDAKKAEIITEDDLPVYAADYLGHSKTERISFLVAAIIDNFFDTNGKIGYDNETTQAFSEMWDYMYSKVYLSPASLSNWKKAEFVIYSLYGHYIGKWKNEFTEGVYIRIAETEGPERAVADYIAGMTDRFALEKFKELFLPGVME